MDIPFRNSLRFKFMLPYLLIAATIFVVSYFVVGKITEKGADAQLQRHAQQIAELLNLPTLDSAQRNLFVATLKKDSDIDEVYFSDAVTGNFIASRNEGANEVSDAAISARWNSGNNIIARAVSGDRKSIVVFNKNKLNADLNKIQRYRFINIGVALVAVLLLT